MSTIKTVIGAACVVALLSGCPATVPRVEVREVIVPCMVASQIPSEPLYTFEELSQPSSPKEEAEAIVALYSDYLNAKAYGDVLRYLIAPCIGVKNEN